MKSRCCFVLLAFAASVSPASAKLAFDTTRIEHEATFEEESYTAVFPFTNNGDETVEIFDVKSSCGCTVPTLEKKTYDPGESGAITAVFTYGSRHGLQHKRITVKTSADTDLLDLQVNIPQAWSLDQRLLRWSAENPAETQTLTAQFNYGTPVELVGLDVVEEQFTVVSKLNSDGSVLTLEITPKPYSETAMHRAEARVKTANGDIISFPFYLRLTAPKVSPSVTDK